MAKKKRDINDGSFAWQQKVVYEEYASRILTDGFALYCALTNYAIDKQCVFPSQKTLCKKLSMSIPTVIKYLNILENEKLIRIERRTGRVSKIYLLKVKAEPLNLVKGSKGSEPLNLVKTTTKRNLDVPLNLVKTNKKNRIRRKNKTKRDTLISVKTHPSLEDVRRHIKEKKISNVIATQFYKWFKDNDFKDTNGKPLTMKNYKAKINTWSMFNNQNRPQFTKGTKNVKKTRSLRDPPKCEYGTRIEV